MKSKEYMLICDSGRVVETGNVWIPAISMADSPVSVVICRTPETLTLRHQQQSSSHCVQVDQAAGYKQPVGILVQATVTDLGEADTKTRMNLKTMIESTIRSLSERSAVVGVITDLHQLSTSHDIRQLTNTRLAVLLPKSCLGLS